MGDTNTNFLQSKKNLKWFESRIEHFNEMVPYQISCLMSCRNNILKQYRLGNYVALKQERTSTERTIRNLKQLLIDIERLREQVKDSDLIRFDKLISRSRENIHTTLRNFNDFYNSLEIPQDSPETRSRNYYLDYHEDSQGDSSETQVVFLERADEFDVRELQERAKRIAEIQQDTQIVNEIFRDLSKIVNDQKELVDEVKDNIETTHERVQAAEKELAQAASKIHGAVYPLVGALVGSCIGGPIGLFAGLKIGLVSGLTGSVVGFSGGKVLKTNEKRKRRELLNTTQQQSIKS